MALRRFSLSWAGFGEINVCVALHGNECSRIVGLVWRGARTASARARQGRYKRSIVPLARTKGRDRASPASCISCIYFIVHAEKDLIFFPAIPRLVFQYYGYATKSDYVSIITLRVFVATVSCAHGTQL